METPVPLISSHLALLARLDQLYESQVLLPDAQPKNVDHPESELPPAEGDLESGSDAWREVAELVQILGDGLKDGEPTASFPCSPCHLVYLPPATRADNLSSLSVTPCLMT